MLFEAIKNKSIQRLRETLNSDTINLQDSYGRTPLIYAIVQKASLEIIDLLIESGSDPTI